MCNQCCASTVVGHSASPWSMWAKKPAVSAAPASSKRREVAFQLRLQRSQRIEDEKGLVEAPDRLVEIDYCFGLEGLQRGLPCQDVLHLRAGRNQSGAKD